MKWILGVDKFITSNTSLDKLCRAVEKGKQTWGLQKLELARAKLRINTLFGNRKQKFAILQCAINIKPRF